MRRVRDPFSCVTVFTVAFLLALAYRVLGRLSQNMASSSKMPRLDASETLSHWGRPSPSHTPAALARVAQVLEARKAFQRDDFEAFIANVGDGALLLSYSGDGTPIWSLKQTRTESGSHSLTQVGSRTAEWFVHNCFAVSHSGDGERGARVLLDDPRPMTDGKTAEAEFAFGELFVPDPRKLGHSGILAFHVSFDRAKFEKHFRLWRQKITKMLLEADQLPDDMTNERAYLLTWCVGTACAIHDAHNSLKWAVLVLFNDKQLLKECWQAFASLCSCSRQIRDYLPRWLGMHFALVGEADCPGVAELTALWSTLGVKEHVLDEIVALRLHFRDGCMWAADSADESGEDSAINRASFVVMSVWTFRRFTEGRVLSSGKVCRSNLGSALLGLDAMVGTMLADKREGQYYLKGYEKMNEDVRKFVAVVGMASFPSDACLRELLKDGRVGLRVEEIVDAVAQQVQFLVGLPESVWEAVASVTTFSAADLRAEALEAMHVSVCFLFYRIFRKARGRPFALGRGDVDANLDALLREGPEKEPTSRKIQIVMERWGMRNRVKAGLRELLQARWDTYVAEQQHAATTLQPKHHPQILEEALQTRASANQFKKLLPAVDLADRDLDRKLRRLDRLDRRWPEKVGKWHQHVQDTIGAATSSRPASAGAGQEVQREAMRTASRLYQGYSSEVLDSLEKRSRRLIALGEAQLEEERAKLEQDILSLRAEKAKAGDRQHQHSLSTCKWTAAQMDSISRRCASGESPTAHVTEARLRALEAPPRLSKERVKEFDEIQVDKDV